MTLCSMFNTFSATCCWFAVVF